MGIPEQAMRNRELFKTYSDEFEQTFKMKLKTYLDVDSPVSLFLGFDIIQFDKDIRTPDMVSVLDHVAELYGEQAEKIIKQLCRIPILNIPPNQFVGVSQCI